LDAETWEQVGPSTHRVSEAGQDYIEIPSAKLKQECKKMASSENRELLGLFASEVLSHSGIFVSEVGQHAPKKSKLLFFRF